MARICWALSLFIPCGLFGQVPAASAPAPSAFTVASIKPNRSGDDRFMLRPQPGGALTATGVTLKMLIMFAYGVAAYVQGRLPPDQFNALLRRLIEDRFQLKSRRKTKKMPVYDLVVTKGGSSQGRIRPNRRRPGHRCNLEMVRPHLRLALWRV